MLRGAPIDFGRTIEPFQGQQVTPRETFFNLINDVRLLKNLCDSVGVQVPISARILNLDDDVRDLSGSGTSYTIFRPLIPRATTDNTAVVVGTSSQIGVGAVFNIGQSHFLKIEPANAYIVNPNNSISILSTCTITFELPYTYEILVVGGGGGGEGWWCGGGGGGGGVVTGTRTVAAKTPYTVTVGAGGRGGLSGEVNGNFHATNGGTSSFMDLSGYGGGAGGRYTASLGSRNGSEGGCGGGAGFDGTPGNGTQGTNGGTPYKNTSGNRGGGGGGSAGRARSDGPRDGTGGPGMESSITGTPTRYGGGGGAGIASTTALQGGAGGGGAGGKDSENGSDGVPNTGGGGGGAGGTSRNIKGGNGGSGIVILKQIILP